VINGELTTYKATIKERNLWIDSLVEMANHAPVILVAGNHGAELEGDLCENLNDGPVRVGCDRTRTRGPCRRLGSRCHGQRPGPSPPAEAEKEPEPVARPRR
jgi:hypothetical protein